MFFMVMLTFSPHERNIGEILWITYKMAKKKKDSGAPVTDILEFRKANEIIAPRVARGGTLSLLGRKVFNVLLYHMQRLERPGVGAPDGDPSYDCLYWLPLSDLAKDSAFNSEDTGLIKDTLIKLQDIKIITDDSNGFSSDVLVASVKIVPGKRGKKTMIGWGVHPATEAILRNPAFYTRLSIYYLTSLRTTSGMALYENCKRYATNPSKVTRKEPWEWWHDVLTGQPIGNEKPEFKYFKRDILKPAIAEVNTTDIRVELVEHKNGRKVAELQFKVQIVAQKSLKFPPTVIIDAKLTSKIIALGFSKKEAEDIFASNDEIFLKETIELVVTRSLDNKLSKLENPAAFFRTALRGRYADQKKQKPSIAIPPVVKLDEDKSIAHSVVNKKRTEVIHRLDSMTTNEKNDLLADFMKKNSSLASFAKASPESRIVHEALIDWLIRSE